MLVLVLKHQARHIRPERTMTLSLQEKGKGKDNATVGNVCRLSAESRHPTRLQRDWPHLSVMAIPKDEETRSVQRTNA